MVRTYCRLSYLSLLYISLLPTCISLFTLAYRRLPHSLIITPCFCLVVGANLYSFIHSFMNKGCLPLNGIQMDMVVMWDINQLTLIYLLLN